MEKDDVDLCEALANWFESQKVGPVQVTGCLAQLLGVVIGELSSNVGDCVEGTILAHSTVVMTALRALAVKLKK